MKVTDSGGQKSPKYKKEVECFNCHKKGHYSSQCPYNALHCTERRVDHRGSSAAVRWQSTSQPGIIKSGVVEGKKVKDILLDTGCSRTLIHKDLVSASKIQEDEAVAIRCAHGDTVLYPLALISLEVGGHLIEVEAAVSDSLPMSVLLGTDTPELSKLLMEDSNRNEEEAFAVTTGRRVELKKQEKGQQLKQENSVSLQSQRELNQCDNPTEWICTLDDELFGVSKMKERKTKRMKWEERKRRQKLEIDEQEEKVEVSTAGQMDFDRHDLDISAMELRVLQSTDPTLERARNEVKSYLVCMLFG